MPTHRRRKDEPTRPRRIHPTDADWHQIGAMAAMRDISISRFVLAATCDRRTSRRVPILLEAVQALHLVSEDLARIADAVEATGDPGTIVHGLAQLSDVEVGLTLVRDLLLRNRARTPVPRKEADR